MYYFKKNIGDYAKKTGRLSMLQHGAYTLLIDACYDREQFPTLEQAIEWTWASNQDERDAVEFVLRKFFTLIDGVYVQKRIREEIDAFHDNSKTNRRIAIEREEKRRQERNKNTTDNARSVHVSSRLDNEAPPNQEPRTKNQEPLKTNTGSEEPVKKFDFAKKLIKLGVSAQHAEEWMKVRKAKRGVNTQTAFDGFLSQASLSGMSLDDVVKTCIEHSWCGFEAEWVTSKKNGQPRSYESAKDRRRRETIEVLTGKRNATDNIIDVQASSVGMD